MKGRDALRTLVDARDHAYNTPKALRLLPRNSGATRRICASCWHVVDKDDEAAMFKVWRDKHRRCRFYDEHASVCWGHQKLDTWVTHRYAGIERCPRCQGPLGSVEL